MFFSAENITVSIFLDLERSLVFMAWSLLASLDFILFINYSIAIGHFTNMILKNNNYFIRNGNI